MSDKGNGVEPAEPLTFSRPHAKPAYFWLLVRKEQRVEHERYLNRKKVLKLCTPPFFLKAENTVFFSSQYSLHDKMTVGAGTTSSPYVSSWVRRAAERHCKPRGVETKARQKRELRRERKNFFSLSLFSYFDSPRFLRASVPQIDEPEQEK